MAPDPLRGRRRRKHTHLQPLQQVGRTGTPAYNDTGHSDTIYLSVTMVTATDRVCNPVFTGEVAGLEILHVATLTLF